MVSLFTQARNGTVSIIKNLTQEEADNVLDIVNKGPEKREYVKNINILWEEIGEKKDLVKILYKGNKNVKTFSFPSKKFGVIKFYDSKIRSIETPHLYDNRYNIDVLHIDETEFEIYVSRPPDIKCSKNDYDIVSAEII